MEERSLAGSHPAQRLDSDDGAAFIFIALILTLWLGFNWEVLPAYTDADMVAGFDWKPSRNRSSLLQCAASDYQHVNRVSSAMRESTRNSVIAVASETLS